MFQYNVLVSLRKIARPQWYKRPRNHYRYFLYTDVSVTYRFQQLYSSKAFIQRVIEI